MADEYRGIDVSYWQGDIDWQRVADSGIEFAMLRASYGWADPEKQTDRQFAANVKGAKAAGIPFGAYHYSYATSVEDAKKEAAFFLSVIKGNTYGYPLAFDIEDKSQQNLSPQLINSIIQTFCDAVEEAGYYTAVYTNLNWVNNRLDATILKRYDLWLARWGTTPGYDGNFGIWQYSSNGAIPGVAGRVDLNTSYRDYPAIMQAKGLNGYASGGSDDGPDDGSDGGSNGGEPQPPPPADFKVGQTVSIRKTAVRYATGENIPEWVKERSYRIQQVGDDRVLLAGIYSWVYKADLVGGQTPQLTVGARVRLKASAKTYATGQNIPDWVRKGVYEIQQMGADRVLLRGIYSWVYKKDVELA